MADGRGVPGATCRRRQRRTALLLVLLGAGALAGLASCGGKRGSGPAAQAGSPGASASPSSTEAPFPCSGWPQAPATVYERASTRARRFGSVAPGDPVAIVGRNAAGWWAIAPGTAQAANVGPFRLRWLPPDTPLRLAGQCARLPRQASPAAGVCFEMAMGSVALRAAPDPSAQVVATLPAGGYLAVTGAEAGGWLRVDAGSGSATGSGTAYVSPQDVNVNGPCDAYLRQGP